MSEPINNQPSCPSWFIKITEGHEEAENNEPQQPQQPQQPRIQIPKVPEESFWCADYYWRPSVVSIGPHHYSDREERLSDMEKLKALMTRQFVEYCHLPILKVSYEEFKKAAQKAKGFYTDELLKDFTEEAFEEMMFIDGCFVLQFIHCCNWGFENLKLEVTEQQIAHVIRDLLLLENQLPFPVLESLMKLRGYPRMRHIDYFLSLHIGKPTREIPIWHWILFAAILPFTLLLMVALLPSICLSYCLSRDLSFWGVERLLGSIFELIFTPRYLIRFKKDKASTAHLLERLHSQLIPGKSKSSQASPGNHGYHSSRGSRGNYVYCSAKNLKRMGIHLRQSESTIKFKTSIFSGTLELPPITIDESTEALLWNLVAYETYTGHQHWATAYICFMASLIKDAEDVEELRSKGIITNYLPSDKEVVLLFSDMAHCLTPDPHAYGDIKKDINEQCRSVLKRWVAECQQKYFSSPWAFIAFVGAALGLILTAISTYKTVFPPRRS